MPIDIRRSKLCGYMAELILTYNEDSKAKLATQAESRFHSGHEAPSWERAVNSAAARMSSGNGGFPDWEVGHYDSHGEGSMGIVRREVK